MTELVVQKITLGTMLRIGFTGMLGFFLVLGTVSGVLALFGLGTVRLNNQSLQGFPGLLGGMVLGLMMGTLGGLFWSLVVWIGLWLNPLSRKLRIVVEEAGEDNRN